VGQREVFTVRDPLVYFAGHFTGTIDLDDFATVENVRRVTLERYDRWILVSTSPTTVTSWSPAWTPRARS